MIRINRFVYSREALLKAAFAFTDQNYIHLDETETDYQVEIIPKNMFGNSDSIGQTLNEEQLYADFENELIMQETRRVVAERTRVIRELIAARALASTMVIKVDGMSQNEEENEEDYSAENILEDWFTDNEDTENSEETNSADLE